MLTNFGPKISSFRSPNLILYQKHVCWLVSYLHLGKYGKPAWNDTFRYESKENWWGLLHVKYEVFFSGRTHSAGKNVKKRRLKFWQFLTRKMHNLQNMTHICLKTFVLSLLMFSSTPMLPNGLLVSSSPWYSTKLGTTSSKKIKNVHNSLNIGRRALKMAPIDFFRHFTPYIKNF